MRANIFVLTALLAGCGYTPPGQTDTNSAKYQADYTACDQSVPGVVDKHNAKTGLAWISGPVTRWSRIDSAMNTCMADKGWGHARACTSDELRLGNQAGSLVVTRNGIRCSDPNKSS